MEEIGKLVWGGVRNDKAGWRIITLDERGAMKTNVELSNILDALKEKEFE